MYLFEFRINITLQRLFIITLICFPLSLISQTLSGKVYDAETTVKGALVVNISQNVMTYSDSEGDFTISAKTKDTLYVSSLFHKKVLKEIKAEDFKDVTVIELKKIVNELDVVLLRDDREKQFDSIKMEKLSNNQIKEDIKRNPTKYNTPPKYGLDFVAIGKKIGNLFKRKNKPEAVQTITYELADSLFTHHRFFNKTLLTVDLNIPKQYHSLFFDYVETKNIDAKFLQKLEQVNLLEELVVSSQEFQILLHSAEKNP